MYLPKGGKKMKIKNGLKVYAAVLCMVSVVLMPGCSKKGIGEEKAKEIAFEDSQTDEKEASRLQVSREKEDGKSVYEVYFMNTESKMEYEYEILADDGTILKAESESTYARQQDAQYKLDIQTQLEEAKALKEGLEEQKQRLEDLLAREEKDLDNEGLQDNLDEVNEELQSVTYHLQDLQTYMENNKDQLIGVNLKEAQELALERVEGAGKDDIVIALEYDDGGYKYEGDIIYGGYKYDFEIHAMTGAFLEWRKE